MKILVFASDETLPLTHATSVSGVSSQLSISCDSLVTPSDDVNTISSPFGNAEAPSWASVMLISTGKFVRSAATCAEFIVISFLDCQALSNQVAGPVGVSVTMLEYG